MLLRTENICKQFNGIYALQGINFQMDAGEIHGLVGENGAGKSTLIKILTGVYGLDEGNIFWNDQEVDITDPVSSRNIGINVIHQDHILIPSFNGVENVYLGREYIKKNGKVDWKTMRETVQNKADELGIEIDLSKAANELSPPQKTCLEIIRAMMNECKLLILDEPTASLTDKEAEILFRIILDLKQKGTSILYVTHRMEEIFRLSDRITIFKNGKLSGLVNTQEVTSEGLIELMTDKWKKEELQKSKQFGDICFQAENVSSKDGVVKKGNLSVRSGEILGIYGLGGSGRTELLETLYGYRTMKSGKITVQGKVLNKVTPAVSIANGVALISEDRRGKAIIGNISVKDNILLSSIDHYVKHGILDRKKEIRDVDQMIQSLKIKLAGREQRVLELSGGNQQKVVFAKALLTEPAVFLCDEPTQAVDVKTRSEIHKLLQEKAHEGKAVIYVSSDLKEILEVADNILIMAGGCTWELLENKNLTGNEVLTCCYRKN